GRAAPSRRAVVKAASGAAGGRSPVKHRFRGSSPAAPARVRWRDIFLAALVLLDRPLPAAPAANGAFEAGAAKRDITPKEPTPMWGYGARHDALSQGVLDPLYAAALVLKVGDHKLAIVGLDLGRAPAEKSLQRIRARIKAEAGIEYSFIAGSHTHHGPVLELTDEPGKGRGRFDAALRYYRQMEDGIVAAVLEANTKRVPAKLAVGSVQLADFNRNRHTKLEPKPSDRELAVMRLDDLAGPPVAVLVNFAAHPTMIDARVLKFSADYVGVLKATVEQATGATAIFMQGAAGDQSVNRGPFKDYRDYGQALGRQVVRLAASLTPREVAQPWLEVREERFRFASRTDLSNPLVRAAYSLAFFPELIPNFADEYADGVRPRLTVAMLDGDVALVGVSGEFFSNHAIRLKDRARMPHLFFFGYCNGYHQYFPTIEAVAEGGYGADSGVSPVAVGAGEQMMDTALIWLYQMRGKIK
ncbi:MAG: neutral/alkaline non-lysosomal ceramidase N-terminal domain-containing protein, partial [Verrucomicrobia bacterium]|nr:neutral/alkaline non-lysosomal ceramidase N-terminal domain-containing protein [Verrucomicrobiota bacterium]